MKPYATLKTQAIGLRKKGLSYNEIKRTVKVSKSTLSLWLKDILLSLEHKNRLYTKQIQILSLGAQSQKERRKREIHEIIEKAENEISFPLSKETYQLIGAFIYWGEGDKTKGLGLSNSDPNLILFMVRWFEKVFGISPKNIKAWLNIYPQQNEKDIKGFWSQLTDIPVKNFGKSYVKPLSKNYKKNNLYYGTIKIQISRGTDLRHRIYGWTKSTLKDIAPKVSTIQKKWEKLREVQRPINLPKT